MRARFLQTAKEVLRRPRHVVAVGLLCAFSVMTSGASSSAFAAASSVVTPEKVQTLLIKQMKKSTSKTAYAGLSSEVYFDIMMRAREGLIKLHEASKGRGDAPIPENEREAFVKKVQGDILDHAFAPFGDERALHAFRKNIGEYGFETIVKAVIDFKGDTSPFCVPIKTEGRPVGILVAPGLDKPAKATPFDETFFDDVLGIKGLTQTLSPKMVQAIRLFVLGHEAHHLEFKENPIQKEFSREIKKAGDIDSFAKKMMWESSGYASMASIHEESNADKSIFTKYLDVTRDVELARFVWADRALRTVTSDCDHSTQFELHKLIRRHDPSEPDLGYLSPKEVYETARGLFPDYADENLHADNQEKKEIKPFFGFSEERQRIQEKRLNHLRDMIEGRNLTDNEKQALGSPQAQTLMEHASRAWKFLDEYRESVGLAATVEAPKNWDGFKQFAVVQAGTQPRHKASKKLVVSP